MESLRIVLDSAAEFDHSVHHDTVPDAGDLAVITKHSATKGGSAAACLTFHVEVDGKPLRVQTVTTVALLRALGVTLIARYDEDGKPLA